MAKNQCERIIAFIEEHGSITQIDALQFGCMRLASRINDLKRQGFPIKKKMESAKNRYGEPINYARYYV